MTSGSGNGWPDVIQVPKREVGHDPLCPFRHGPGLNCQTCEYMALARADEQEKRDVHWERVLYDSQARHEEKVAAAAKFARADEREKIGDAIAKEQSNWSQVGKAALEVAEHLARNGGELAEQ